MIQNDITTWSATKLAKAIREKEFTVVEVIEIFLNKIERINPKIQAFVTVMDKEAREAAKEADRKIEAGEAIGPLHGVPIAIKDLTPVKNVRYTMGSKLFQDQIADRDAVIVERIKNAGAIIIGKTNTPEFGHKGTTDNLVFGASKNPWNTNYITGGSSGGSAAAVAAQLVPIAEGTDGGGSIRIPASLCGVFGFKPSYGRVPMDIFGPFSSQAPFLHYGPISRTIEDSALLYDIMKGPDLIDAFCTEAEPPVTPLLERKNSSFKVAVSYDFDYFEIDSEVQNKMEDSVDLLKKSGIHVEEVKFDFDSPHKKIGEAWFDLWCGLLASSFHDLPEEQMKQLEPKVQEWIKLGKEMDAIEYLEAYNDRDETWLKMKNILDEYDFIITPTIATTAFPLEQWGVEEINGQSINPMYGWFLTYPINLTGHPAASIPIGLSHNGLPIGLQVIGNRLDDLGVLQFSRAYERLAPWINDYKKISL